MNAHVTLSAPPPVNVTTPDVCVGPVAVVVAGFADALVIKYALPLCVLTLPTGSEIASLDWNAVCTDPVCPADPALFCVF